ncbi:response regulator transcription factor [Kordia sp. YSTF-M3]|uniref:Response regulator transcription factor n=1 Tax=Kordia aestuariivivens TaxID=2759037 RepID=A0ABR7Q7H3_9FLAO|nr:response regulator transcription factor [Kordia aestuariivivens]MBC8754477.1 response regulator transcription factor [Kordia aestuariivivens]
MKKTIFIFATLIIALLALFQLSKFSIMQGSSSLEFIIAAIAIIFFFIGIYINKKRAILQEKPKTSEIDHSQIEKIGLSKREYEVLCKLAKGHSNKEIASLLFVSESTIKTHVSNIYIKLDVKRRTQAIQKAIALQILPVS